ncbi:MAG: acyl-CoA thioesterase [Armatimonadetes bacterium]|nr:acyl-CoA thioesterase [Armatimonadota bacterium]
MSDETRYPVRIEFPVAWGEMDALAHVNNIIYFRYFESARIAYFREVGMTFEPAGPILANTSCDFVVPITYPDTVRVECGVTRIGRSSFTMAYRVFSVTQNTVAARGQAVCVWYDYGAGKSAPLPEDIRGNIAGLEAARS